MDNEIRCPRCYKDGAKLVKVDKFKKRGVRHKNVNVTLVKNKSVTVEVHKKKTHSPITKYGILCNRCGITK